MWLLENISPFRAERTWVRDRDGSEIWIVAVRAVFDIHPDGSLERADGQQDVVRTPVFVGDPAASGLVYDSDLVRTKVATDVVLHGHACSPSRSPVASLDVRLKVGPLQKTLTVHGDRVWERGFGLGVRPSDAVPFTTLPIVYERAFGGTRPPRPGSSSEPVWEPRNPIGVGLAKDASDLIDTPVPNVEYPDQPVTQWKHTGAPAAFAPIPQAWLPRRAYAGTYDETWMRERQPLVPEDFDDRHYQCAPADQQVAGFLKGGESVELTNLSAVSPVLRFALPQVVLGFTTYFSDGEVRHHRADLHTVILEPDYPRVILVWHTAVPCHAKVLKLQETVVRTKQRIGDGASRSALAVVAG